MGNNPRGLGDPPRVWVTSPSLRDTPQVWGTRPPGLGGSSGFGGHLFGFGGQCWTWETLLGFGGPPVFPCTPDCAPTRSCPSKVLGRATLRLSQISREPDELEGEQGLSLFRVPVSQTPSSPHTPTLNPLFSAPRGDPRVLPLLRAQLPALLRPPAGLCPGMEGILRGEWGVWGQNGAFVGKTRNCWGKGRIFEGSGMSGVKTGQWGRKECWEGETGFWDLAVKVWGMGKGIWDVFQASGTFGVKWSGENREWGI